MRMRWKIAFAVPVVVGAVLGWLLLPRSAHREQLLEAAWAEERAMDVRRAHVDPPLPAGFGELLEPHLAELHDAWAAYRRMNEGARTRVANAYKGEEPVANLDGWILQELTKHRRAMRGALHATHAQSARAPASMRLFAFWRPDEPHAAVMHAGRLAAIDMLLLLDQGRADEAAEECADAMALGRDLSYTMVLARMMGVGVTTIAAPACARALSAASPETLRRVQEELIAVRRGTPRFSRILEREWLFSQIVFGDPDPRLPEAAQRALRDSRTQIAKNPFLERLKFSLFRQTAWEGMHARMAKHLEAQRLEWPACVERMKRVAAQRQKWNAFLPDDDFATHLRRHRDGLLKLDALVCAASASSTLARSGSLPGGFICPPREPEARCGEQDGEVRVTQDAQGALVSVALSDGSEFTLPIRRLRGPSSAAHREPVVRR